MAAASASGYSQHAGMVIVCDGTEAAARRIERVLWNDPASGVMRHADAGYDIALDCARETWAGSAGDRRCQVTDPVVIARSGATKQSPSRYALRWRLPRRFAPGNDSCFVSA